RPLPRRSRPLPGTQDMDLYAPSQPPETGTVGTCGTTDVHKEVQYHMRSRLPKKSAYERIEFHKCATRLPGLRIPERHLQYSHLAGHGTLRMRSRCIGAQ